MCRIGVVPQESNQRANEGTEEDHQLLGTWDIHYIKVGGKLDMTADISQDAQCHTYYRRVAGAHPVHTVIEVGTVGDCRHHEDGHDDEENPACRNLVLAAEAHNLRIVEVVALHKRNGGLQGLHGILLMLDDHLLSVFLLDFKV